MTSPLHLNRLQRNLALPAAKLDAKLTLAWLRRAQPSHVTRCWYTTYHDPKQTTPLCVSSKRGRKPSTGLRVDRRFISNIDHVPYEELTIGVPKDRKSTRLNSSHSS